MANYALVSYPSAVSLTEIERKLPLQFSGHTMSLISLVRKVKVDEADHLTPFELRVSFAGSFGIPHTPLLYHFSVTQTSISSYETSSRVLERLQDSVFVIV